MNERDIIQQAIKLIVLQTLQQEIDFSIYPAGGPTADGVAEKIASALRDANYAVESSIGSTSEYRESCR